MGPNGTTALTLIHGSGDIFTYQVPDMPPGFRSGVSFAAEDNGVATGLELEEINSDLGSIQRTG